jgi:RHS repeat-associated protein
VPVNGEFMAADYDGDGLPDLVAIQAVTITTNLKVTVRRNITQPQGMVTFAQTPFQVWSVPSQYGGVLDVHEGILSSADFNGDGRADIGLRLANTVSGTSQAAFYALLSNGFSSAATVSAPISLMSSAGITSAQLGDVNADGCTDVLSQLGVYISDCTGGFRQTASTINIGKSIVPQMLTVDWDGDGRTDILYDSAGTWTVARSNGDSMSGVAPTGISVPASTSWFTFAPNGDGSTAIGFVDGNNSYAVKYILHAGANTPPDLATSFTDGLGMNQSPTYVSMAQNNYTKNSDALFPEQDYQGSLYVVNQFTASDGTGSTYQDQFWYYGAAVHAQGRGFEGFYARRTYDSRNALYTYDYFDRPFPYTGIEYSRNVTSSAFADIRTWTSTPTYQTIVGLGGYEQRYFPFLQQTVLAEHEYQGALNGTYITNTTKNYEYGDGYGNVTKLQTTTVDEDPTSPFSGLSWQTTVVNQYSNSTSGWCLGLPTSTTVQSAVPGQTTQTRTYSFIPDTNVAYCRTSQVVVEPTSANQALTITETFGFDSSGCGNVTSASIVGHNPDGTAMPSRTSSRSYGARCQLPETITNALGQASIIAYNYDFGAPTQLTDPNGLITKWQYDDFGRESVEIRPDNTYSGYTYYSCNTPPCWGVNDLRLSTYRDDFGTDSAHVGSEGYYWDGLGRQRYDQSLHAFGTLVYDKIVGYDSLGRATYEYQPVSSGSNGYYTYSYDPLNRMTSAMLYQSNGSLDRTYLASYAGRTTQVTNPGPRVMTYVQDATGLLRRVTDPSPGGTTSYDYDAFGNLAKVTDAIGAVTAATYNQRGFRTQLVDADAGTWNYQADSLNELVSYTDANSHSFGMAYDALGRMTSRSEPEGTSTWMWGHTAAAHDIGALDSVSGYGYSEALSYDALGRLATKIITSDQTYQYDYSYNSIGGLDTVTYPVSPAPTGTTATRFKIQYGYSYGVPIQISDITQPTAATLWALSSVNDYSSPTNELLGAGTLAVTSTHKVWTNELTGIQSGVSGSANNRQNLSYQWDLKGNLVERWDQLQNVKEDFIPDALNRVSSSTLNTLQNLSVTYDASGNILTRSDVGTYTYDPVRRHELKSAGSAFTATYDSNGNVLTRNGLAQTWASFNLPTALQAKIGSAVYSSEFSYGPDHERYRQSATYSNGTEVTSYAGGLFEKVTGPVSATTYYRHYVPTPSEHTIIIYRNSNSTTSTVFALADHLGSTDAVVSGTAGTVGNLLVRESFDAFGQRRQANWAAGSPSSGEYTAISSTTRRGFTFHEQLDNIGLTHMNGRVYDPLVGRFLSVDPLIGNLGDSQSVNPYAYVGNRPLSFVDPTGFDPEVVIPAPQSGGGSNDPGVGGLFSAIGKAFSAIGDFLFGGGSQRPIAQALPGYSAQSGIGVNPCSAGCAEVIIHTDQFIGPDVVGHGIPGFPLFGTALTWEAAPPGLDYLATITVTGQRGEPGLAREPGLGGVAIPLLQAGLQGLQWLNTMGGQPPCKCITGAPNLIGGVAGVVGGLAKGAELAQAAELANGAQAARGSFSIVDWAGYPAGVARPTGPLRLLQGSEYSAARSAANSANRALRGANPSSLAGRQIHEIQPVKFGGSPTDLANKIPLTGPEHSAVTNWWNQFQRYLEGLGP